MACGHCRLRLAVLLCGVAVPAHAQQTPSGAEIFVYGERQPGGARSERLLTARDIETYGAGSIGELIEQLAAERGETSDDLVYIVNGRRVTGLRGIDAFPPEALDRLEILAAGSAPRVGGLGGQRIVSLILKREVRTAIGRATLGAAADGEGRSGGAEIGITDIRGARRINLTLGSKSQDALTELDRNIVQDAGAPAARAAARTLRPDTENVALSLSASDEFGDRLRAELNLKLVRDSSRSGLGLGGDGLPIGQRIARRRGEAEIQLDREAGDWLIAFTGHYSDDRQLIRTGRGLSGRQSSDTSRTVSRTRAIGAELNANGPLFDLPAGPLDLRLRARLDRDSLAGDGDGYAQTTGEFAAGVHLPIASAAAGVLPWLGELSAGIELSRSHVNKLGTLASATYSLQWQPAHWVRLAGSITTGRTPPAIDLIAAPLLATPGVRTIDPLSGETLDVVELSGGNPALGAQRAHDRRLSLNLKPLRSLPLLVTADYSSSRNRDIIASLPAASALLLATFPDRFLRDANGVLTQIDSRPIAFARRSEEQLRYGLNFNLPLAARSRGARLQLDAAHTILLSSELALRPGVEPVDLLSRDAIALGGSARPRHSQEFSLGYAERGLGLRLTGQRRGTSYLGLADDGDSANALRFAPLTVLSLRGFIDGQRLLPGLAGMNRLRLGVTVTNLTNARQRVRESRGETPLRYQPGMLDPIGRSLQLELRKAF